MRIQAFKEKFYILASAAADRLKPLRSVHIPRSVEKPCGNNVLVLAPHFDDEIIGCGGTLCRHKRCKDNITILYFTDGNDPEAKKKNPLIGKIRKEEAMRAANMLGVENLIFFDIPENSFRLTKDVTGRLVDTFNRIKPDLVYLPWFLDGHIHHISVNRIFLEAFNGRRVSFNCCAYEVWTPMLANIIVDISEYANLKKKALKQYRSQIEIVDYPRAISGLNSYRAIVPMRGKGHAEAFIYLGCRSYIKLIKNSHEDIIN